MPEIFTANSVLIIAILLILNGLLVFLLFYKDTVSDIKSSKSAAPDDYINMVVHELRSPLSVIKGTSDMIVNEFDSFTKDQIKVFLTQMQGSAGGLLDLVNNILDQAKIKNGKFEVVKDLTDLNALLEEEVEGYREFAKHKDVKINFDKDVSVQKVLIDGPKVKQVLNNLLSNAIKFTSTSGTVRVSTKHYGQYIEVCVSDSGCGIPQEIKAKMFNAFVQGKNSMVKLNPYEKGTGLGLAISKGIVEAHGGKIWFEDNVPHGTRFLFTLPIA